MDKIHFNFNKKPYTIPLLLILVLSFTFFYYSVTYKNLLDKFKDNFNNNKFLQANNVLINSGNLNPLKSSFLEKDLNEFFTYKISIIEDNIDNNTIDENQAINIINEINKYDFANIDSSNLLSLLNYKDPFEYGLSLYNTGDLTEAYNTFSTITSSNPNYNEAINYMNECKSQIKDNTLSQVNELRNKDYYTKALNLLDSYKSIIGEDTEIKELITEIQNEKSNFLNNRENDSVLTSTNIINKITANNINSLSIDSLTSYILYVDITMQKTFIYKGTKNNWSLLKTINCSTGIKGEETPSGIFTVQEKGDWFFSDKYNQGGKYWVQFTGDYLFHSLPFAKDKETIVDYTLGEPASHGCIRLLENDSKWIYDNIPRSSKVIIK